MFISNMVHGREGVVENKKDTKLSEATGERFISSVSELSQVIIILIVRNLFSIDCSKGNVNLRYMFNHKGGICTTDIMDFYPRMYWIRT